MLGLGVWFKHGAGVGADGLMIEVHNNPQKALCDGPQSLTPEAFADVVKSVNTILEAIGKKN